MTRRRGCGYDGDMIDSGTIQPGLRVRITQQLPRLSGSGQTTIEGVVVRYGQQKTGSWFAHSKDKKLWLDRLEIRRDDGEMVHCNMDQYSVVEVIETPAG